MAWLVSGTRVLASAEILEGHRARAKGLIGRSGVEGAVVLEQCAWIHTLGMGFALDVAYLDRNGTVIKTARMQPHRVAAPVIGSRTVIEAQAGSFARWDLHIGDVVEVRD